MFEKKFRDQQNYFDQVINTKFITIAEYLPNEVFANSISYNTISNNNKDIINQNETASDCLFNTMDYLNLIYVIYINSTGKKVTQYNNNYSTKILRRINTTILKTLYT